MDELLVKYSNNELELNEIEKQISVAIAELQNKQQELQNRNEEIKNQIKDAMEKQDIKKYENDFISITYVEATTRNTVDSAKLKEKYLDVYNDCIKISDVKSSIRIKVKDTPKEKIEDDVNILGF